MRDLMEHYSKLKGGLEACKGNIRRMKSSTFDEYIEEKTHRNTLGESRLSIGKSSNPTEIFVWQKKPGMEIVERFMDLPHDDDLVVDLLSRIAMKYDGTGEWKEDACEP